MKAGNHAHSSAAVRKRSTQRPVAAPKAPAVPADSGQKLAEFAGLGEHAVDAERWPTHPLVSFQPELTLSVPTSGLRIERLNRLATPDFQRFQLTPCGRPDTPLPGDLRMPEVTPNLPHSDVELLGWEPRAILVLRPSGSVLPLPRGRGSDSEPSRDRKGADLTVTELAGRPGGERGGKDGNR